MARGPTQLGLATIATETPVPSRARAGPEGRSLDTLTGIRGRGTIFGSGPGVWPVRCRGGLLPRRAFQRSHLVKPAVCLLPLLTGSPCKVDSLSHRLAPYGTLPTAAGRRKETHRLGPPDDPVAASGRQQPPCWTCSTVPRWLNPLPHRPLPHWTPPFMNRPHPISPVRTVGTSAKGRRLPALKTLLDGPRCVRRGGLVRWHHPRRGTHLPDGGLVPLGQAAGTPALGLGSGPTGRIHSPGLALHRSVGGPDADPGGLVLRWQRGGHLPGGAGSPNGSGDPAPVVGPGHCPQAGPAGSLLDLSAQSAAATTTLRPIAQRLGTTKPADLRGCHRPGAPAPVAASEGFSLSAADPDSESPGRSVLTWLVDSLATRLEMCKVQVSRAPWLEHFKRLSDSNTMVQSGGEFLYIGVGGR